MSRHEWTKGSAPTTDTEYASTQEGMDSARERACKEGMTIVIGEPNVLLLDLDDGAKMNYQVFEKLIELFGDATTESWASRGAHGTHIKLTFDMKQPFTPAEALALECALGSDPLRTLFGVARLHQGVVQPRMLFRPLR